MQAVRYRYREDRQYRNDSVQGQSVHRRDKLSVSTVARNATCFYPASRVPRSPLSPPSARDSHQIESICVTTCVQRVHFSLQKFLDNGMMMRLKSMKLLPQSAIEGTAYQPVRMVSVVPILAILCGGVVLSVALLITEKIHHRRRERKLRSKVVFSRSRKQFVTK